VCGTLESVGARFPPASPDISAMKMGPDARFSL
jgi:hypothetical protein